MSLASENRFILQGYYNSENQNSNLTFNEHVQSGNNELDIDVFDGWQVALKKIIFDFKDEQELKSLRVPIGDNYNLENWMVEIYLGAWKCYNNDPLSNVTREEVMYETRAANDASYVQNYYNAVTNIDVAKYPKYKMNFAQPMAPIMRIDIAKNLQMRFGEGKTITIQNLLNEIRDYNEYKTCKEQSTGMKYSFTDAIKFAFKQFPDVQSKKLLSTYFPDDLWKENFAVNWSIKMDYKERTERVQISNIPPYCIHIAIGSQLLPFVGFDVLDVSLDEKKAIIWKRYEQACFNENSKEINKVDQLSWLPEGCSMKTGDPYSKLLTCHAKNDSVVHANHYFIYSNNVHGQFVGDDLVPLLDIIPGIRLTTNIRNDYVSYEPETLQFCELKDQQISRFHFTILDSKGEKIVVKAYVDLLFRLI